MSTKQCVFWGIFVGVIFATIIMFAADALPHGEGKCLTDVAGNVRLSNGGWVKIIDHLEGTDLDGYVHGHRNQYYDKHGKTTKKTSEFYDIEFGDFFANCPSAPPPPKPRRKPQPPPPTTPPPTTPTTTPPPTTPTPTPPPTTPTPPPTTPTPTPRPTTPRPRSNPTPSASAVIELPAPDEPAAPPDDRSMIDNPVEAVVETVELVYHKWLWRKGYNLISFPVMKPEIETIADLYQAYALFNAPQDIIYVVIDGCWFTYNGQDGQVAGQVQITPYLGVLMVMDWATILGMHGVAQIGDGELELMPGLNVVGLSEMPSRYRVPSDFLMIDGIEVVMVTAWNDEKKMSDIRMIGRAGDPGDTPLNLGQAVMIISTSQLTLDLSGEVASAPGVHKTLKTSWGAMKRWH